VKNNISRAFLIKSSDQFSFVVLLTLLVLMVLSVADLPSRDLFGASPGYALSREKMGQTISQALMTQKWVVMLESVTTIHQGVEQ
jgi:hypothetical protein